MSQMKLSKRNKLLFGVGINDADYNVYKHERINGKQTIKWSCPFYVKWKSMLQRCYSEKCQDRKPTYIGCSVVPDWLYFSKFKSWMEQQDWEGKQLDKDILFVGNKEYGPETCVFIDAKVNLFLTESNALRGEWPIGTSWHKNSGKYMAKCWGVETGKRVHLGLFDNPEEAHQAWLSFKLEQANILAARQSDERIAKALVFRYENYGTMRGLENV